MKQFITLLSGILFLFNIAEAQYFQGSASQDPSDKINLKIAFKMRPTGNLTTSISYIEAAFRYPTSTTTAFTLTNITSNTAAFPGLAIQRFTPDYISNGYTYIKFVFNTGTIPSAQYTAGTEYQLFTITTSLPASPVPAPVFEMISNQVLGQYQFGVVDGAGNLLNPGSGAQLYGANFRVVGNDHIITIPVGTTIVPVKFSSFNVTRSNKNSLLTWTVENQDAGTSYYDIERSLNGTDFVKIGTVRANPGTGPKATYTFTDQSLSINVSAPLVYYRIRQVDADGKYVYTGIQNIVLDLSSMGASLYPNPALHYTFLSMYLSSPKKISIEIFNVEGKRMQEFEFTGTSGLNRRQVDVSNLAKGVYNLVIREGNYFGAIRFLKID